MQRSLDHCVCGALDFNFRPKGLIKRPSIYEIGVLRCLGTRLPAICDLRFRPAAARIYMNRRHQIEATTMIALIQGNNS